MKGLVSWTISTIVVICIAVLPADGNQHRSQLYFSIQIFEINQEGDKQARVSSKVKVHRDNGDTVLCDDMSDEQGTIKCLIECDPSYRLTKTFHITFLRHSIYRTPSTQKITLRYNCILEPEKLEATYIHWQYAHQNNQNQYKRLTANAQLLWEFIGSSKSYAENYVYDVGVSNNLDASAIKLLYDFGQQSLNLSESYLQLGNQQQAENFQRQVISAAQGLLIPYQTVFGGQQSHFVTGDLGDYQKSLAALDKWFDNIDKTWDPNMLHESPHGNQLPVFQVLSPVQRKRMWDSLHFVENPLDQEQFQILFGNSSTLAGVTEYYSTYSTDLNLK